LSNTRKGNETLDVLCLNRPPRRQSSKKEAGAPKSEGSSFDSSSSDLSSSNFSRIAGAQGPGEDTNRKSENFSTMSEAACSKKRKRFTESNCVSNDFAQKKSFLDFRLNSQPEQLKANDKNRDDT